MASSKLSAFVSDASVIKSISGTVESTVDAFGIADANVAVAVADDTADAADVLANEFKNANGNSRSLFSIVDIRSSKCRYLFSKCVCRRNVYAEKLNETINIT